MSQKILVVDDDPTIQKLISSTLSRAGYETVVAKDGLDAMVLLKKEKPALIVLDIMMPELNGYDVCHQVKFDPGLKDVPIILLTARDQELDPRIGGLMGIDYMHKSSHPSDLIARIHQVLKDGPSVRN